MGTSLITVGYLVASILFILSLRGLSSQETSRQGNWFGIIGMTIAIVATMTNVKQVTQYEFIVPALIIAVLLGATMAARVAMTAMPELVALLHSFVGLAAVLVGFLQVTSMPNQLIMTAFSSPRYSWMCSSVQSPSPALLSLF